MKHSFLKQLICPISKEKLKLFSFVEKGGETKEGILVAKKSRYVYPIINYVPIMLDFKSNLANDFFQTNQKKIKGLSNLVLPNNQPRSGEKYVQTQFSKQWVDHGSFKKLQYGYIDAELRLQIKVQLGLKKEWFKNKLILNVGCGKGREAMMIADHSQTKVTAVDLNFSMLELKDKILEFKQVDFVVASLFNLPFKKESFDYIFSHGVIHHTYSTKKALFAIIPFLKEKAFLYIWVYGIRGNGQLYYGLNALITQHILRPFVSRLPTFWQSLVLLPIVMLAYLGAWIRFLNRYFSGLVSHPSLIRRPDFYDIFLQIRDSHAVFYSHWQSMPEVIMWLKEAKMKHITPLEVEKIPAYLRQAWLYNVGLRSQRS